MKASPATPRPSVPGEIVPGNLYTLSELSARLRLGSWGLRRARRAGLRVMRYGGRGFVVGSDVIEFLRQQSKEPTA